jgi:hypothetical protein
MKASEIGGSFHWSQRALEFPIQSLFGPLGVISPLIIYCSTNTSMPYDAHGNVFMSADIFSLALHAVGRGFVLFDAILWSRLHSKLIR